MNDFLTKWVEFYPSEFPLTHMLRSTSHANWLRFHALPESKRYAEYPEETKIILNRMNSLGDDVLGDGATVFMVLAYPTPFPSPEDEECEDISVTDPLMYEHFSSMEDSWNDLVSDTAKEHLLKPVWTFSCSDDECNYEIYSGLNLWKSGKYNCLLQQIADDEIDRIFWMSADTGAIFAPYDGGIDLIMPSVSDITRLRTKYADWLPNNSMGL